MMTGYPGFISGRLYRGLKEKDPSARFTFLVHPSQMKKARQMLDMEEKVKLVEGDITQEDLGMESGVMASLQETVTHFFHLAAIYDLAVPKEAAEKVNVTGTDRVNQFVRSIPGLKRYLYFSTAYVSGERTGRVTEEELDQGQRFKNHYESTKFEAEKRVRALDGVPLTIIRPGVVVGDSRTGETAKFDGPYFVMRFLDGMGPLPIPYIGHGRNPFNIVPVDYIVNATVYLAHAGKDGTFHLTDPSPYTAREVYRMISEELLGRKPMFTLPARLADGLMSIKPVRRYYDVEKEAIAYMTNQSDYDSSHAQAVLAEGGIRCPDFASYLPNLVSYYKKHREDPEKKIKIQ
ncbi:thioester reductase-like protein [Melghirimyces profundicolus]|uniref:Thioester reductase-like protein n=2 Tax=Melghirimyces profundicolus TaxID=1242148 RepID=A0A2T6C897_9BACL|nr:thioester reductase-like protein [Melghirimyces profundicolus]